MNLPTGHVVVGHLSPALPAVAAGFIANAIGLSETFELLSAGVVVVALTVAAGGLRIEDPAGRPSRALRQERVTIATSC